MKRIKIVSGGQTGADRGALDAALQLGLPHGGWCPAGRKSEDGIIPAQYVLREHASEEYPIRTEMNVLDSDATLIFYSDELTGGSLQTLEFAVQHNKISFVVDTCDKTIEELANETRAWIEQQLAAWPDDVEFILNVAGPRGSKQPTFEQLVLNILVQALS